MTYTGNDHLRMFRRIMSASDRWLGFDYGNVPHLHGLCPLCIDTSKTENAA